MVDFDQAFSWLRPNGLPDSHLSTSSNMLVRQLREAVSTDAHEKAWKSLELLNGLRRGLLADVEVAEVLAECGRAEYKLGNLKNAQQHLREAIVRYHDHEHQVAVVQWLLGHLLWLDAGDHSAAIHLWQHSVDAFYKLFQTAGTDKLTLWYQQRWQQMNSAMQSAIDQDGIFAPSAAHHPPGAASSAAGASPASSPAAAGPAAKVKPAGQVWSFIQWLGVSDQIPAGGFRPLGVDPAPVEYLQVEQVKISGQDYRLHNLRGGNLVKLGQGFHYAVVKVIGDSMDLENIEDGDYVLLRVQTTAEDNDIVAAEINAVDSFATLKKFRRQPQCIRLEPSSRNSIHRFYEFLPNGTGFSIRGVAMAVFKRI